MWIRGLGRRRFESDAFYCFSSFLRNRRFFSAFASRSGIQFDPEDGESTVYRRVLQLQKPSTVNFHETMTNFASLIGVIDIPFKNVNTRNGSFGVHTLLRVDSSSRASKNFRIMLHFWGQMAEMAVEHLNVNDLIYVSGALFSYMKMDKDGESKYFYKVTVREVDFVAQCESQNPSTMLRSCNQKADEIMRKRKSRLHLWQIFFANPDEWWDNRKNKPSPRCPDFKHKDTGEALWLSKDDPLWISKQLSLQDSRLHGGINTGKHLNLSSLVYD